MWLPIEANPEVMSKFIHACGTTKDWTIHDVYGLDEGLLAMLPQPVKSLLLLFPINEKFDTWMNTEGAKLVMPEAEIPKDLFYMHQTISNACGTVALMHAVGNNLDVVEVKEGSPLAKFFQDTKEMSPAERAVQLENNEAVGNVHDEVAKEGQTAAPNLDDKVDYHFLAFVEKNGILYELDGRKKGPISYGKIADGNFLQAAAVECKKYMERDPENVHFTLVALAPNATD